MLSGSIHAEVQGLVIKLANFSLISYTPKVCLRADVSYFLVRTEIASYVRASVTSYVLPLPAPAYPPGKLHPKGISFSGFSHMKGSFRYSIFLLIHEKDRPVTALHVACSVHSQICESGTICQWNAYERGTLSLEPNTGTSGRSLPK